MSWCCKTIKNMKLFKFSTFWKKSYTFQLNKLIKKFYWTNGLNVLRMYINIRRGCKYKKWISKYYNNYKIEFIVLKYYYLLIVNFNMIIITLLSHFNILYRFVFIIYVYANNWRTISFGDIKLFWIFNWIVGNQLKY